MRLFEFANINETIFIKKIRRILGTDDLPEPEIFYVDRIKQDNKYDPRTHGLCSWVPGEEHTIIQIKRSVAIGEVSPSTNDVRRLLAHELCHDAEFLTHWYEKFYKSLELSRFNGRYEDYQKNLPIVDHGPVWQQLANKVNSVYGKDFVTKVVDYSYDFTSKRHDLWVEQQNLSEHRI